MSEGSMPSFRARRGTAARPGSRSSGVARVVNAPAAWLTLIVGISTLLRGAIGSLTPSPWILPDEIVYSELAKSIASGERPSIRGVPAFGWGEVYPTLIAPAWALFDDPVTAYHAALVINALVMSSAAIPAYLLARHFVAPRLSLLVAGLTVAVPSMSYTGVVMTENAAYPVFLLGVLLVTRAVRRPTLANQGLVFVGLALVALTRVQGLALAGAYVAAVACYALTAAVSERAAYLRRFVPSTAAMLLLVLLPPIASVASGGGPLGWLGSRSGTFAEFHPLEIPKWFTYLVSDLLLYVAVAPAAATVVMIALGLSRRAAEPARLFAAVALATLGAMLASVAIVSASLDVDGTENLNERYVFYVVPIAFVGLATWISSGLPRPRAGAWLLVAGACLLTVLLPIDSLAYNAGFQSVALIPWILVSVPAVWLAVLVGCFTLACGLVWITCRPERSGRLWLLTAGVLSIVAMLTIDANAVSSSTASSAFHGRAATWVDDAVPDGVDVAVLWGEPPGPTGTPRQLYFWLMATELFNTSLGDVYRFGPDTYYEVFLPTIPVRSGPGGTIVDGHGDPVTARYALVTCQTAVAGEVIATSPRGFWKVVRVDSPLRLNGRRPCQRVDW